MLIKTFRGCIGLGVLIAIGPSVMLARGVPASTEPSVSVAVHNDAGVKLETVVRAEEIASEIFRRAGIDVKWIHCGPEAKAVPVDACLAAVFPTNLQLRIVRRSRNLKPGVSGISYLEGGIGCYSEIFVDPVAELHENFRASLASVLGHVAAHEIAHLLLGPNSHSATGMMRARWSGKDLVSAGQGGLLFSKEDGEIMKRRLSAGVKRSEEEPQVAARMGQDGAN